MFQRDLKIRDLEYYSLFHLNHSLYNPTLFPQSCLTMSEFDVEYMHDQHEIMQPYISSIQIKLMMNDFYEVAETLYLLSLQAWERCGIQQK